MKWVLWAILLVLQQLSQTISMRSRMSASYGYHAVAAIASNGIWFASQIILVENTLQLIDTKDPFQAIAVGLFYLTWTVTGSLMGMWLAGRWEKWMAAKMVLAETAVDMS